MPLEYSASIQLTLNSMCVCVCSRAPRDVPSPLEIDWQQVVKTKGLCCETTCLPGRACDALGSKENNAGALPEYQLSLVGATCS